MPIASTTETKATTVNGTVRSCDRIEVGSVNVPLAELPLTAKSEAADPAEIAAKLIEDFNEAFATKSYDKIGKLFLQNGYWRDHLCLSWDLQTLHGSDAISQRLQKSQSVIKIAIDDDSEFKAPKMTGIDAFGDVKGIQFFITVLTEAGTGRGVVRLAEREESWEIFTLFTGLQGLSESPEPLKEHRSMGAEHGGKPDRKNWSEKREADMEFTQTQPDVLIIGAGQAGLTLAARLKMLGVPTLIIDTENRIGDNWRRRYRHLVLHDPVWFDHMPYLNFPSFWPVYTPKDKLGDFFESYANLLELNVWTETSLTSATFDEVSQIWSVQLQRRKPDGQIQSRNFSPRHVVLATGHSGKKNMPNIPGMDTFKGDRLCHSSEFPGASAPKSNGRKAVVVGSCNSAHDIAQNFAEQGYDVTLVQRSSTCVVSSRSVTEIGLKPLYCEEGPPTEDADIWFWSIPASVFKTQQVKVTKLQNEYDNTMLRGLAEAGFQVDRGTDDSGLLFKYFQRGGGYYIDVGASQLIVDGKIKVKQGQEISRFIANGLEFADGSTLEADEIVLATGYQNMKTQAGAVVGGQVMKKVNDVWGFNEHGELRTMWQKSGHPGFWFSGGNLAVCRYYSRILALQIKARLEGLVKD